MKNNLGVIKFDDGTKLKVKYKDLDDNLVECTTLDNMMTFVISKSVLITDSESKFISSTIIAISLAIIVITYVR